MVLDYLYEYMIVPVGTYSFLVSPVVHPTSRYWYYSPPRKANIPSAIGHRPTWSTTGRPLVMYGYRRVNQCPSQYNYTIRSAVTCTDK